MERFANIFGIFMVIYMTLGFIWMSVLMIGLFIPESGIDWQVTWEIWENASGTIEHIATVIALIFGGVWAYYRFFKERVYEERLDLSVGGEIVKKESIIYLLASAHVKNVGQADFKIIQRGSGIEVQTEIPKEKAKNLIPEKDPRSKVRQIKWDTQRVLVLFEGKEHALEPGELISDQVLAEIKMGDTAIYRLKLVINSSKYTWSTVAVINGVSTSKAGQAEINCEVR